MMVGLSNGLAPISAVEHFYEYLEQVFSKGTNAESFRDCALDVPARNSLQPTPAHIEGILHVSSSS